MSDSLVLFEVVGTAAVLTLNRPEKRNALSRELVQSIAAAVARAAADAGVRSLILTGRGPAFCAGLDLAEVAAAIHGSPADRRQSEADAAHLGRLLRQIAELPKPTIAAVNGPAVAGGAGLMTVCDVVVASTEARIGYPEVRRGLVAAMVMSFLIRQVGDRAARWLLLSGEVIDAATAQRIGLINEVVEPAAVLARALHWAERLAHAAPRAMALTKHLLGVLAGGGPAGQADRLAQFSGSARWTDEAREGLAAFFERRPAAWEPHAGLVPGGSRD